MLNNAPARERVEQAGGREVLERCLLDESFPSRAEVAVACMTWYLSFPPATRKVVARKGAPLIMSWIVPYSSPRQTSETIEWARGAQRQLTSDLDDEIRQITSEVFGNTHASRGGA